MLKIDAMMSRAMCGTCVHALLRDMGRSVLDAEMKISIPKNESVKLIKLLSTEKMQHDIRKMTIVQVKIKIHIMKNQV